MASMTCITARAVSRPRRARFAEACRSGCPVREAFPRANEERGPDDRDRDALGDTKAECHEPERQRHIQEDADDRFAPGARPEAESPREKPNHEAEDERVHERLDVQERT